MAPRIDSMLFSQPGPARWLPGFVEAATREPSPAPVPPSLIAITHREMSAVEFSSAYWALALGHQGG